MKNQPILPPATIGILGSGQLGRMLAVAARTMGYRVHVYSPRPEPTPTGQLADIAYTADYDDLDSVGHFARGVDVVTYEFENVPADTAAACAEFAPLRPGAQVLHVAQNRLREKGFFANQGLPVTPFAPVHATGDLEAAIAAIGTPAILKTATSGYDGKGQQKIDDPGDAAAAWKAIGEQPAILEAYVPFEREVSVVGARGLDGSFTHFGIIQNDHANHILDVSQAPANVPAAVVQEGVRLTRAVLEGLDVVGVLCVEFFLTEDGRLLLNEIAPRPHNSGHLTIEACITSQFEQQLRAVCGLQLGNTRYVQPAAMANILGDVYYKKAEGERGGKVKNLKRIEPDWTAVLANPAIKLHLYDKQQPRPGRKMGHITALAGSATEAAAVVRRARQKLIGS